MVEEGKLARIRKLVILQRITEKRILHGASAFCSEKISELSLKKMRITS